MIAVLAACGSERGEPGAATPTTTAAVAAVSPAQRAAAEAASMLAAFRPPPGATRTGPLAVAVLAQVDHPMTPDLVTRTRWYRAPGAPRALLAWITEHCPAGLTFDGFGGVGWNPVGCGSDRQRPAPRLPGLRPGMHFPAVWSDIFGTAAGQLLVSVAADGPGQVAIRVDSQVIWQPARLAAERVPPAARVVTITHLPGSGAQPAGDVPVTVTGQTTVARIAAIVDRLPVFPPGIMSCPLGDGSGMRLTFRAAPSGPAVAVVTAQSGGCGAVAMTIDGRSMPALADSPSLQQQVAAAAGLPWPAGQVPVPGGPTTAAAAPVVTAG
jgi:hypothetical protein